MKSFHREKPRFSLDHFMVYWFWWMMKEFLPVGFHFFALCYLLGETMNVNVGLYSCRTVLMFQELKVKRRSLVKREAPGGSFPVEAEDDWDGCPPVLAGGQTHGPCPLWALLSDHLMTDGVWRHTESQLPRAPCSHYFNKTLQRLCSTWTRETCPQGVQC